MCRAIRCSRTPKPLATFAEEAANRRFAVLVRDTDYKSTENCLLRPYGPLKVTPANRQRYAPAIKAHVCHISGRKRTMRKFFAALSRVPGQRAP
jgi:hypothetical protein